MNTIRTRFVQIGNSRGLRIPKAVIEQLHLGDDVELAIESGRLVVQSASHHREGWDEQFRALANEGADALMDEATPTEWDKSEWEW